MGKALELAKKYGPIYKRIGSYNRTSGTMDAVQNILMAIIQQKQFGEMQQVQEAEQQAIQKERDRNFELELKKYGLTVDELNKAHDEKLFEQQQRKEAQELLKPHLDEYEQLMQQFGAAQTPAERRQLFTPIVAKERRIMSLDPNAITQPFFDSKVALELIKEPEGPSTEEQRLYQQNLEQREMAVLSGLFRLAYQEGGLEAVTDLAWNGPQDETILPIWDKHRSSPEFKRLVEQYAAESESTDLRDPTKDELAAAVEEYTSMAPQGAVTGKLTRELWGMDWLKKDRDIMAPDFSAAPTFLDASPDSARVFMEGVRRLKSGQYDITTPEGHKEAFESARNDYALLSGKEVPMTEEQVAKAYAQDLAKQLTSSGIGFESLSVVPFNILPAIELQLQQQINDPALVDKIIDEMINNPSYWEQ